MRIIPLVLLVALHLIRATDSTAVECSFALSPSSTQLVAAGGQGTFLVRTSPQCRWSVQSSAGWIVPETLSGTGTSVVRYRAASNQGPDRSGEIIVSGTRATARHSLTQQRAACPLVLTPSSRSFGPSGGLGTILVSSSSPSPFGTPGAELVRATSSPLRLVLEAAQYRFTQNAGDKGERIEMDGFLQTSVPGEPILPFRILEVSLPENIRPSSMRLLLAGEESTVLAGRHEIPTAASPAAPDYEHPEYLGDFAPAGNGAASTRSTFLPQEAVKLASVAARGGEDGRLEYVARILYSPFKYNSFTGELALSKRIELTLTFEETSLCAAQSEAANFNYVIVTTNAIKNGSQQLASFIEHKWRRGFSVKVVTEDDYDSLRGPYPNGRAERIRQWLINNWQALGIEYVLLIGNPEPDDPLYSSDHVGDVPMKQVWWGNADGRFAWGDATDLYYADLTGNWDADGDGFYGENPWKPRENLAVSILPAGVNRAGFSARWEGTFTMTSTGLTVFYLDQWKGARVSIYDSSDRLVGTMNQWPQAARRSDRALSLNLAAGTYRIVAEYFQDTGHGHFRLMYETNETLYELTGFTGTYFNNLTLAGFPVATAPNQTLALNWETGDYVAPPGIGVDLDPEVSVGRIPVYADGDGDPANDYAPLDAILLRTIAYESTAPPPWRKKVLVPIKPLDPCVCGGSCDLTWSLGEGIRQDISADFSTYRIYDCAFNLNPPPEMTPCDYGNVISTWNQGYGLVSWFTHGSPQMAVDVLRSTDLTLLDGQYMPFTFQASCSNGWVYLPDCYPNCPPRSIEGEGRNSLAYSILRDKGVASVAATEVSRGGGLSKNLLSRYNADFAYFYTLKVTSEGLATGDALRALRFTPGNTPYDLDDTYRQQLIFNLFGDPSVRLLGQPPPRCTWQASSDSQWLEITALSTHAVSYRVTPLLKTQDTSRTARITLLSDSGTRLAFTVTQYPHQPPVLSSIGKKQAYEGSLLKFNIRAIDPDQGTVSRLATILPPGATFNTGTGVFQWRPAHHQVGLWRARFLAYDFGKPRAVASEEIAIRILPTAFYCDYYHGAAAGDPDFYEVRGDFAVDSDKRYRSHPFKNSLAFVRTLKGLDFSSGFIAASVRFSSTAKFPNASVLFGLRTGSSFPGGISYRYVRIAPRTITIGDTSGRRSTRFTNVSPDRWYDLKVRTHNTGRVDVYLDRRLVHAAKFEVAQSGKVGCAADRALAYFDNFVIARDPIAPTN